MGPTWGQPGADRTQVHGPHVGHMKIAIWVYLLMAARASTGTVITTHDDVINMFHGTGPLCGEFTERRWIPQWRGALMCSLICAWTNSWANNGDAGDLRRHHAHYHGVIAMHAGPVNVRGQAFSLLEGWNIFEKKCINVSVNKVFWCAFI